ncbi:hypothetical protein C8R43DRAFT_1105134 [Mycena crocata]|nr:hypothetical protein C8R43DRAFT_1105134 [Mycena crocata]
MPQNFRERVDVTSIIRSILDSYPLGNGILRELLQNSDDSAATKQMFILDLRTHPCESLVDTDLIHSQGPSLLAVNDSIFTEADWTAIRTIHNSSKTSDETKIGKFGIGVRACYHITDNPHFLSRNKLAIFDPHDRFSGDKAGGVQIDVATEGAAYSDQLVPFENSLVQLRTSTQAARSTIKQTSVDSSEIRALFHDFVQKELSVVLLFLKHVHSVSLEVIEPNGVKTFIGSAEIPDRLSSSEQRKFTRNGAARQEHFRCVINVTTPDGTTVSNHWRILHSVGSADDTISTLKGRLSYDLDPKLLAKDKLFSHVALAFPINYRGAWDGRLFTLLPLPISTGFPAHVHAILALTQDRQSLRNIQEIGTGAKSRERLLVTWNESIFDKFLPAAWGSLIRILVEQGELEDTWSAWPTSGPVNDYWKKILPNLINYVVDLDLTVFPILSDAKTHVPLSSALVAAVSDDSEVLMALSRVGLSIIQPPRHIHNVLRSRPQFNFFLNPVAVRQALLTRISALEEASEEDKTRILEYLVLTPGTASNIFALPLVPLVNGTRISLSESSGQLYALVTAQEEEIFRTCDTKLISLSKMPHHVADVFRSSTTLNVIPLDKGRVQHYLETRFAKFDPGEAQVDDKVEWLTQFWRWIFQSDWEDKGDLMPLINHLYLLPTAQGTLREMRRRIVLPMTDTATMEAWSSLEAFLDQNPPRRAAFLTKFVKLPIFPTRMVAQNPDKNRFSEIRLSDLSRPFAYVKLNDRCPVPLMPGQTFLDVGSTGGALGTVIDPKGYNNALDELGVLEMAIDHWKLQSSDNLDALLDRIIRRLPDLSVSSRDKLQYVRFVPVQGGSQKLAPNEVIDPGSDLADIFKAEPEKFPDEKWGKEYLPMLTSHGFLLRDLTPDIVEERITYLSQTWAPDDLSRIFFKAKFFLIRLDTSWDSIGEATDIVDHLARKWLPIARDRSLAAPSECWDQSESQYSFDLVLQVVDAKIRNRHLRTTLGWSELPVQVLTTQFRLVLTQSSRAPRLYHLIKELARRKAELTADQVASLKIAVSSHSWVPTSRIGDILQTKYSLLRPSKLCGPGSRFHVVPQDLLEGHGRIFLEEMGCLDSPFLETLLDELNLVAAEPARPGTSISWRTLELLQEIARFMPDCTKEEVSRILVPGKDGIWHPVAEVYFPDTTSSLSIIPGVATDPGIPESLARALRVQFLSSLQLGDEGDEDDDLQMGEDFAKRVGGILKEHDVHYALNEFLANAVDAKATEFSVTLDERTFESSDVVAPGLANLQQRPALILFNNAVFTPEDFRGLRTVGQGGKGSDPDTIGQYGLGALSLFHFTDVVQLVSADYLLILDPSGLHLPPIKGKLRTSLMMPLSVVLSRYPDQLACFDSLHKFSKSNSNYNGTLFRLPLRHETSPLSSTVLTVSSCLDRLRGPYFDLAKDAMYFTCLKKISANRRPLVEPVGQLWSVSASRKQTTTDDVIDHEIVTLKVIQESATSSEKWLVTKSATLPSYAPPECKEALAGMKLNASKAGIVVRIAFLLKQSVNTRLPTHYFFSSLRLPIQSSLPAHIHAQFSISSDRRHIRLEPPNGSGTRIPQSAYNHWILDHLIPPLYISSVAHVPKSLSDKDPLTWWPTLVDADEISRTIVLAFYNLLPTSSALICSSLTSHRIAPKDAIFCKRETPAEVIKVLRLLECRNLVHLYREEIYDLAFPTSETEETALQTVDAIAVKKALGSDAASLTTFFGNGRIGTKDVDGVLLFLLKAKISIAQLPLFVQADNRLVCVNKNSPAKYCPPSNLITKATEIFQRDRFVQLTREARELLQNADVNIKPWDADGVLSLLGEEIQPALRTTHSDTTGDLIAKFWNHYEHLPGPPELSSFDTLPLIPTMRNGEYISAQYCQRDDAISKPAEIDPSHLLALQQIGVVFYRPPQQIASLKLRIKHFTLSTCIRAIQSKAVAFSNLHFDEGRGISEWIRDQIYYCPDADKNIVSALPIWVARQRNTEVLLPAPQIHMLPFQSLHLDTFTPYLKPAIALAEHSLPLQTVLGWPPARRAMSSTQLAEILDFPPFLGIADIGRYSQLLTAFLSLQDGEDWGLRVPDGNLTLRPVDKLYDHSNDLFQATFQLMGSEQVNFLHPSFRDLHPQLRSKGLRSETDWDSFHFCVQRIDEAVGAGRGNIVEAATVAYQFYNSHLPLSVGAVPTKWEALNRIRFIPRHQRRSSHSPTFAVEPYCVSLPAVVSPSQLVQEKYEQVVWTQCGLFLQQPGDNMIAVNSSLGVPNAKEVVAHLAVLALRIAPEHPRDPLLLQHIQATYQWLNDHNEAARQHLLSTAGALFLNIDDPTEPWEWRPASQLLFNVEYDYPEMESFRVRQFLQDYRPMLLAAGAGIEHAVDYKPQTTPRDGNALRESFNTLRKDNKLTDMVLMPTETMGEGEEDKTLRAHSAFVAAVIPHVEQGLVSWNEHKTEQYSFPGSRWGACAILDFIYTGRIEPPDLSRSNYDHDDFLRDLLELLGSADEWYMPELKDEIGRLIKQWRLLSRETYRTILENARSYQAESLVKYCEDWRERNPDSVRN